MNDLRKRAIQGIECWIEWTVNSNDFDLKKCADCPYNKGFHCLTPVLKDALELIKREEPRVMTLEEVKDSIGEAIYFESRGTYMGKIVLPILPALFTPHGLMRYVHPQSRHFSELGLHDYGKTWRCWTARPTDEQRKAEAWEE